MIVTIETERLIIRPVIPDDAEAMRGIIDCINKKRPIRAIQGQFAVENSKSRRVMEKLGMQFYKESEYTKLDGSATFKSQIYMREFS